MQREIVVMSCMTEKQNFGRLAWIDALKGIAICGVIMIHSGGANLPSYLGKIGCMCQTGSGYSGCLYI